MKIILRNYGLMGKEIQICAFSRKINTNTFITNDQLRSGSGKTPVLCLPPLYLKGTLLRQSPLAMGSNHEVVAGENSFRSEQRGQSRELKMMING